MDRKAAYLQPLFTLVLASSILHCFYSLFFHCSSLIWSFNTRAVPSEYTPWIRRHAVDHDGIEAYVLYAISFLVIISTVAMNSIFRRIKNTAIARSSFFIFSLAAVLFYLRIGFFLPMAEMAPGHAWAGFTAAILAMLIILGKLLGRLPALANCMIMLFLVPICLISADGISLRDYGYVFSPALRILHGFKPNETYFQYDYLLSLIAAVWMKVGLSAHSFKILGQLSYYALFAGIYFFARRFFVQKRYALYLLISMVIVRIYGNISDPASLFQITPLRLDLWFLLILLVFYNGLGHWIVGLAIGALIVVHHAFGLVYAASYLVLIASISVLRAIDRKSGAIGRLAFEFCSSYMKNILFIFIAFALYETFFKSAADGAVSSYQRIGIGFIPIAIDSFYWHVPAMLAVLSAYIIKNRNIVTERRFETGLFLVILAVGNSIYFFGRSHENNIINISSILLLCFFLLMDALDQETRDDSAFKRGISMSQVLSAALILTLSVNYSGRAIKKAVGQGINLKNRQFFEPARAVPPFDMQAFKKATRSSKKVIFISDIDFYYYISGGYVPQNYYSFTSAWIFKKDLVNFLNNQLASGHYLASPVDEFQHFWEILDGLDWKHGKRAGGFAVISNNPIYPV